MLFQTLERFHCKTVEKILKNCWHFEFLPFLYHFNTNICWIDIKTLGMLVRRSLVCTFIIFFIHQNFSNFDFFWELISNNLQITCWRNCILLQGALKKHKPITPASIMHEYSKICELSEFTSEKHVFNLGTKSNIRTSGWKIDPLIFSFKPQISISNLPSVGLKSQSSVWKKKSSSRFFTLGTKLLFI
jgi:hypothetical protein